MSNDSTLKTTGQFRKFLLSSISDVKNKELEVDRANSIARLSAQVNHSMRIELLADIKTNKNVSDLGEMKLV